MESWVAQYLYCIVMYIVGEEESLLVADAETDR